MQKNNHPLAIFCAVFLLGIQAACSPGSHSAPTPSNPVPVGVTPTTTPHGYSQSQQAVTEGKPTQGTLSINFIDALIGEVCSFDLPVEMEWNEGQGVIKGETEASCALSAIQCGDACVTMNSDWELAVSLSGTLYSEQENTVDVEIHSDLLFSGVLKNYASEWPQGSIPVFTVEQPFILEQPGLILPLVLPLKVGASTSISPEGGGEPINIIIQTLS